MVTADDGLALHVEIDAPDTSSLSRRHLAGRTPTVVLVHGFALTMQCWVLQRRALIHSGFRVVTYDQRGHGRSGQPSLESCTVAQLGRDLAAVMDATCTSGPVVLVGHSMGGMTVMSYAGQHPDVVRERVLAVALVSTSPGGAEMTEFGLGTTVGRVVGSFGPGVLTRLSRHAGPIGALRKMGRGVQDAVIQRWAFDSPVSADLVHLVGEMIFSTSFDVMAAFLPDVDALDISEDLAPLIGIETLVMNGAGDLRDPALAQRGDRAPHPRRRARGRRGRRPHPDARAPAARHPAAAHAHRPRPARGGRGRAGEQQAAGPSHRAGHREEAQRGAGPGRSRRSRGRLVSGRRVVLPGVDDTRALGRALGRMLRAGDLVVLTGGLGAGKTTLTQGIGEGVGVRGPVTSPTFVIARVHPSTVGGPALVHVDAYRLGGALELDDLDLDASVDDSVTVVEWGHGLAEDLSEDRLEVVLDVDTATEERTATVTGIGGRWAASADDAADAGLVALGGVPC